MRTTLLFSIIVTTGLALVACVPKTSAGMATSVRAGTPLSAADGVPVTVTLTDDRISSSQTSFKIGVPYTLLIRNVGPHEICFDVSVPVAVTGSFPASAAQALLAVSPVALPAGQQAAVKLTFPESAAGTPLEFSCLMRRPYEDGMRLRITVTR